MNYRQQNINNATGYWWMGIFPIAFAVGWQWGLVEVLFTVGGFCWLTALGFTIFALRVSRLETRDKEKE